MGRGVLSRLSESITTTGNQVSERCPKSFGNTTIIGGLLRRADLGEESAREEIVVELEPRLRRMAQKMLSQFPRLIERGRAEAGMVVDDVLLELYNALKTGHFNSPRELIKSAGVRIRSTLLDLSRKCKRHPFERAQGIETEEHLEVTQNEKELLSSEDMEAFHRAVETLSDEQKKVFTLLYYKGFSRKEVAEILRLSERTVSRRNAEAKGLLSEQLKDDNA
jgi:RNA polymerase sigma-70 factor (ECF subfamily)